MKNAGTIGWLRIEKGDKGTRVLVKFSDDGSARVLWEQGPCTPEEANLAAEGKIAIFPGIDISEYLKNSWSMIMILNAVKEKTVEDIERLFGELKDKRTQ